MNKTPLFKCSRGKKMLDMLQESLKQDSNMRKTTPDRQEKPTTVLDNKNDLTITNVCQHENVSIPENNILNAETTKDSRPIEDYPNEILDSSNNSVVLNDSVAMDIIHDSNDSATVIDIDDPELLQLLNTNDFLINDYLIVNNHDDPSNSTASDVPTTTNSGPSDTIDTVVVEVDVNVSNSITTESCSSRPNNLTDHPMDSNCKSPQQINNVGLPNDNIVEERLDNIHNEHDNDVDRLVEGRPKKGRKRLYQDQTRTSKKIKVNTNQDYITVKGEVHYAKEFRDYICNCTLKCNEKVSTEERNAIFSNFYRAGTFDARCLLLQTMVKEVPIKRKRKIGSEKRNMSREYFLANTKVCKNIFMQTLRVSSCSIQVALKKKKQGTVVDGRGSAGGRNKLCNNKIEEVVNHISKFPRYVSHYCRSTSKAEYLNPETTLPLMYKLYSEETDKPVSQSMYKQVFYSKFNLKRKSLKKDTCKTCDTLAIQQKNTSTNESKLEAEKNHKTHLEKADYARKLMNEHFEMSKCAKDIECISFDLEKTLPLPRIPTNIVFYKRQLWLYNCGIHDSKNKAYCYTWVEGDAGRGAQEIGSCLKKHIMKYVPEGTKHLMLWSDSCGGQNRNIKLVLLLKTILEQHLTLETVTQHFLVPGHTFLKNDADFSDIESSLKKQQRLYVPDDYINVFKECRRKNKLIVEKMEKGDFFSTKLLEDAITNRKKGIEGQHVNWLKFTLIQVRKSEPFKIFVKSDLESNEFHEIDIKKKGKKSRSPKVDISTSYTTFFSSKLSLLWPEGKSISKEKLQDLKSMFNLIPKDCLSFYKGLKGSDFTDDVDGFSGALDFDLEEQDNEQPNHNRQ